MISQVAAKSHNFFIFNVRHSVFENMGIKPFEHLNKYFTLVPVITNQRDSIENRANMLKQNIKKTIDKANIKGQINLACYSVSGIDARYALTHGGLKDLVANVFTIGTPHQGSRSAQMCDRKFFKGQVMDPITRLLGIGMKPFSEVVPQQMKIFNQQVPDCPNVNYFSIGGECTPINAYQSLQQTCKYLRFKTIENYVYENDGVFGYDEIKWGNYLVNFEVDHAQLIGITRKQNLHQRIRLIETVFADKATKEATQ